MLTIYALKSRFQHVLRPLVRLLAAVGVTANQVTLAAMCGSVLYGVWLSLSSHSSLPWLLLPLFLFCRMGLNAIDGMLAREFDQQSRLGAILNEAGDVVSDSALYLPFMLVALQPEWVLLAVLLAILSEFIGVLGPGMGASRRYDGPMGKSDRAFWYGALALAIGLWPALRVYTSVVFGVTALLLLVTIINRSRMMLREAKHV
ncbi:MAG: CDP-alcohol phosphatidyltransferase family protein [Shewanella sp.]